MTPKTQALLENPDFRDDVLSGMNLEPLRRKYGGMRSAVIVARNTIKIGNVVEANRHLEEAVAQTYQTTSMKPPVIEDIGAVSVARPGKSRKAAADSVEIEYAPPPFDAMVYGEKMFGKFEEESHEYLTGRRESPPDIVRYRIKADGPIAFVNFSDLHLGAKGCDHRKAREDAELVRETPGCYASFGGDGVDNFIKIQAAMINADSTPEEQYAAFQYWLSLFGGGVKAGGKLLGGVSGNHDYWTKQLGGIDYLRRIFAEQKLVYYPHRLRIVLMVNDVEYRIELRHTYPYKSTLNQSNQLQRMYDLTTWQWHIGCVGHTHDGPFIVPFQRHGVERWGCIAGSYKGVDSHAEFWGYNPAFPNSPMFILNHEHYDITGINDLRKGIETLTAMRGA